MSGGLADESGAEGTPGRLRLDKWLWYARFHKSRTLAAEACARGHIRLNGTRVDRAHQPLRPGDVLTFPQGSRVRVVRVLILGKRRGPATEARTLYEDLSPPPTLPAPPAADAGPASACLPVRDAGAGRPTKAERRALDRLRDRPGEAGDGKDPSFRGVERCPRQR